MKNYKELKEYINDLPIGDFDNLLWEVGEEYHVQTISIGDYDVVSYDTLKEGAKYHLDQDNIVNVKGIVDALNEGADYYVEDCTGEPYAVDKISDLTDYDIIGEMSDDLLICIKDYLIKNRFFYHGEQSETEKNIIRSYTGKAIGD